MSNKAIFFDRDDTLIEDPGYINHPDQVKLLDGVADALAELKNMEYKLIVVSNQSGVARGIVTEKILDQIHDRLKNLLAEKGAFLDAIYYCPHHPDGVVKKYRKESDLRKPNPGMLLAAAKEIDIDFSRSWMIGNSGHDIEAGKRAGCKTILIDSPSHETRLEPGQTAPDHRAINMKEVVNILKKYHRSSDKNATNTKSSKALQNQPTLQAKKELSPSQPENSKELQLSPDKQDNQPSRTVQLLEDILRQLKNMQRTEMFDEFSVMRLLAGIVQILVPFCLVISIWFLMSPTRRDNSVLISLGFAAVLQVMALTFYIMQRRK